MNNEHLLAYYRWDQRTHWKLDSLDRSRKPVLAYVNYNDRLWNCYAKKGAVVWVLGLGPDETPTLEARIPVHDRFLQQDDRRPGWRVQSKPGEGTFFGLNNAAPEIMKVVFANERAKYWSLRERQGSTTWVPRHGYHLRASRRIAAEFTRTTEGYESPGTGPLEALEERALEKSMFISWKHKENQSREPFLRDLAIRLTKLEYTVWFDRYALGGAEEVAKRPDNQALMTRLLGQGLEGCKVVLGVWTDEYGRPSKKGRKRDARNWTKREWQDRPDVKRIALVPGGQCRNKPMRWPHDYIPMPENPSRRHVKKVADAIVASCDRLLKK